MRPALLSLCSLFFATMILAQESEAPVPYERPRLFVRPGILGMQLTDLNRQLDESGFAEFESVFTVEYGMSFRPNKKRFGMTLGYAGLHASNNNERSHPDGALLAQDRTLRGEGFELGVDYYLLNQRRWKIYVPARIQFMKMKLATFRDIPLFFDLSNSESVKENKFTSWKECLETGLNFETAIPLKTVNMILGANAGYRLDYGGNPWRFSDEIPVSFPDLQNEGWLFGLTLGMQRAY